MNQGFYLFVLISFLISSACSWVSRKCFVYEDFVLGHRWTECPRNNLTGSCEHVFSVELDLAAVPAHVQVLCLSMEKESTLYPNGFSRFTNLRTLTINGYFKSVLPGAFRGLQNLQTLFLQCSDHFNSSISCETFSDLSNLRTLNLRDCWLSSMAVDVFSGMNKLTAFDIINGFKDLSEVWCRLANASFSLKRLSVSSEIQILKQTNCTLFSGTEIFRGMDFDGVDVHFYFSSVKEIHKDALRNFNRLSSLVIPMVNGLEDTFQQSDIREVNYLKLFFHESEADFELICDTVFNLSVKYIHLVFRDLKNDSESAFRRCSSLETMELECWDNGAPLTDLTFTGVLRNLSKLSVSRSGCLTDVKTDHFPIICKPHHKAFTWLKTLSLSNRNFKNVSSRPLACLYNLQHLTLRYDYISTIEDGAFQHMSRLKTLNLGHNKISVLGAQHFVGLYSLETLVIEENPLMTIEPQSFVSLRSIKEVTLGVLNFPSPESSEIQLNLTNVFGGIPENLTYLSISSGIRPMTLIIGGNDVPNTTLTLYVFGQSITFKDCKRPFFESVHKLTAKTEQLLCESHFAGGYFKSLEQLDLLPSHKTMMDLTDLNQLVHLRNLTIMNMDLFLQPHLDIMFHNLTRLENLTLIHCWIHSLEKDLSKDLQSLRVLYLLIDNEFSMSESFFDPLRSLSYLIMVEPRLVCSCDNAWLSDWVKQQRQVQVYLSKAIVCKNEDGIQSFSKYTHAHCFMDLEFLFFVSTSLVLLLFMLVVLLYKLAGEYLLAFFYIARGWVEEAMRRNERGRYQFDAFVSYCGKDEPWVVEELLPNLEQRGPPFLRLCLHARDFQPGKDIVENITDSLYRSRRTLCLVSRNFLRSNWCSLEMQLATHRLLTERRDILILVFLEKIPSRQLSAHHRLARLVKTRTYINWPQDPTQREAFWDRLWAKLAPQV